MRYKTWERKSAVNKLRSPQVTFLEKWLLVLLNEYAGMEGELGTIDLEKIADEAIMSHSRVTLVFNSLQEKGLIGVFAESHDYYLIYSAMGDESND